MTPADLLPQVLAILALVALNGWLAMAEFAILAAGRTVPEDPADPRSRALKELGRDLGRFLSTIQVGITIVAVTLGAVGEASLAGRLTSNLLALGVPDGLADVLGMLLTAAALTWLCVVFGELVPKRLALARTRATALHVARPMLLLRRLAAPAVRTLDLSSEVVLRVLRVSPADEKVTEDEVEALLQEAVLEGTVEKAEQEMVGRVFRLDARKVEDVMTPAREVAWLDTEAPEAELLEVLETRPYSRFPVARGSLDRPLGVVAARDVLLRLRSTDAVDLQRLARAAPDLPLGLHLLDALRVFRRSGSTMALVRDAEGRMRGILTLHDLLEAMVGRLRARPRDPRSSVS